MVLLILALLVALVIQGQELIRTARVRSIISQQDAAEAAVLSFQDRFRALPGDYRDATTALACTPPCPSGNGNGRIDDTGTPREFILVWAHLSGSGFLNVNFTATSASASPTGADTPRNAFGGYMQVVFDKNWGYSGNPVKRHNIKTGNGIPVDVIAEIDRKIDDGLPTSGRVQFTPYAGTSTPLNWGGLDTSCTNQDIADRGTVWNVTSGVDDCGATTLF